MSKVINVFISQPMKGLTSDKINSERARICKWLDRNLDQYKLIDSFVENEDPPSDEYNNALWCLGRTIEFLAKADVVVFVDGWHHARGCKIEFECCVEYGIPMMFDHGAKYE